MANLLGERWSELSGQQKISAALLAACGFFVLGAGIVQLRSNIRSPFLVSRTTFDRSAKFFANQEADQQKIEDLKIKDTDHDGISDYDESYVQQTSPYLADTDSDGLTDAVEITQGTDPNCPQGKTCVETQAQIISGSTSTLDTPGLRQSGFLFPTSTIGASERAMEFINNPRDPATMKPAEIRAYLLSHNLVPKNQIDLLSDEAVVQAYSLSYQQALRVQSAGRIPAIPSAPSP